MSFTSGIGFPSSLRPSRTAAPPTRSTTKPLSGPDMQRPKVSAGGSGLLGGAMRLLKASAVLYLVRTAGAMPSSTPPISGALLPGSVPTYETAEDLVRELAGRVGITDFYTSGARPTEDGLNYKLAQGPDIDLVDTVMAGLKKADTGGKPLSLHVNSYPSSDVYAEHASDPYSASYYYGTHAGKDFEALNLRLDPFEETGVPINGQTFLPDGDKASVDYAKWSRTSSLLMQPFILLEDPASLLQTGFAVCNLNKSRGSRQNVIIVTPLTDVVRPQFERMIKDGKFDKHCIEKPPEDNFPAIWKFLVLSSVFVYIATARNCQLPGGGGPLLPAPVPAIAPGAAVDEVAAETDDEEGSDQEIEPSLTSQPGSAEGREAIHGVPDLDDSQNSEAGVELGSRLALRTVSPDQGTPSGFENARDTPSPDDVQEPSEAERAPLLPGKVSKGVKLTTLSGSADIV